MKKLLMAVIMIASISFAHAQIKGTNTIGLGVGLLSQKTETNSQGSTQTNEQKNQFFSLGYGSFVKDNERLGIDFFYGKSESDNSANQNAYNYTQKNYGGKISYQKYIPLLKKFYAFGGGRAGYEYSKSDFNSTSGQALSSNSYSVGGYGGLTWFLSKRVAFETDLLSANIIYSKTKNQNTEPGINYNLKSTSTNFNLTTAGAINNLGFKIYFLF